MGEFCGSTGEECVTALVIGYDIHARLGEAMNPAMYRERGIDATGVCGSVAVAAVAGRLMGRSEEQIANAMGIASLFTGAFTEYQNDGTSGKYLCTGWACLSGVRAATLAKAGFTGPIEALEGKKGYFQGLRGSRLELGNVLKDLKKDFKINAVYLKQHACMRGLHAGVDAMLKLREKYGLTVDNVDHIEVKGTSFTQRLSNPLPKTIVAAQSSMQFSLATVLKYGHIYSEETLVEGMSDEDILRVSQAVVFKIDERVEEYLKDNPTHYTAVSVVVYGKNKEVYEQWAPIPEGDVEMPYSVEQIKAKFMRMVEGTPYQDRAESTCANIFAIENLKTVSGFFQV